MKYRVHSYTDDTLFKLLSDEYGSSKTSLRQVKEKSHAEFFKNYFSSTGVDAKTIVEEKPYTDKDYLIDYASYYVRCFEDYPRTCTRLHFFAEEVSPRTFRNILLRDVSKERIERFKTSYLGFIVVRPLQTTIVGRTCLVPYKTNGTRRFFPTSRAYNVNLFGLELQVRTLAFQEQDHVAAACATSALWSVFQGTAKLFQHRIPSPAEITKSAIDNSPLTSRAFPNTGLTAYQMASAINHVGLEPVLVSYNAESSTDLNADLDALKTNIYAYTGGHIPVLLLVPLIKKKSNDKWFVFARHAVAVTGYHCCPRSTNPDKGNIAHFIDKLYVHDDQIGPHARMVFKNHVDVEKEDGKIVKYPSMSTSWGSANGESEIRAIPETILIPLYHKVRIPCEVVHEQVLSFVALCDYLHTLNVGRRRNDRITWEIVLTDVNSIKSSIHRNMCIRNTTKSDLLLLPLPLFIWRVRFKYHSLLLLDVLFDATGISQGNLFLTCVEYDDSFTGLLRSLLAKKAPLRSMILNTSSRQIADFFIQ